MKLPLPLRNRLAALILEALHDRRARAGLEAVVAVWDNPRALGGAPALPETFPDDLFERRGGRLTIRSGFRAHETEFCQRARRGWQLVRERPFDRPDAPVRQALRTAACLFDAGLFFEVHEYLEPYWMRSEGSDREGLKGLIQVAVGFQHLANGNVSGARLLLREGCARLNGRRLAGVDLGPFAAGVERCQTAVAGLGAEASARFPWTQVPRFPVRA